MVSYRTTWNQISGRDPCTPWRSSYILLWEASLLDKSTYVPKSKTELLPPWLHGDGCTFSSKIPTALFRWKLIVYNSMIRSKFYIVWSGNPRAYQSLKPSSWKVYESIKNERHLYTLIGEKQMRKYTVEQFWPWKPGKAMTPHCLGPFGNVLMRKESNLQAICWEPTIRIPCDKLAFRITALPPTCLCLAGLVDHAKIGCCMHVYVYIYVCVCVCMYM